MLAELLVKQGLEMSDEGIAEIPILIAPIIDEPIREIFQSAGCRFLPETIDGLVQAVWGFGANRKISYCQKEITSRMVVLMEDIRSIFEVSNLNSAQRFALDYLIRGLIASRVLRMASRFRADLDEKDWHSKSLRASLCPN